MDKLTHEEVIHLLMQLGVMILSARMVGELFRRFKQPMVVGEIIAGILLGPTILGSISPDLLSMLFPSDGASSDVLDGFIQVAVVLLLFIAGLEVELDLVVQQGKKALLTSLFSMAVPFAIGFAACYSFPSFFGSTSKEQQLILSLFIGTTLSITALPVIARVLMDLNIFKSKIGMLIISSAMIIDLLGWLIFTVILSMMEKSGEGGGIGNTILLTLGFAIFMLTIGKGLINKALPWINKRFSWPGGVLSMSIVLVFFAAAFTEYIGIHAIFGSFILGVAMGESENLSERAKEIVHQFINNIFAPLFFVSIGLHVNFFASFNLPLVLVFVALAFIGKVTGATWGARLGGVRHLQAWAVGFGMNTHGTLEVILGAIALKAGLINDELFVAIVVMVVITIVVSAPSMKYLLERRQKVLKMRMKQVRRK